MKTRKEQQYISLNDNGDRDKMIRRFNGEIRNVIPKKTHDVFDFASSSARQGLILTDEASDHRIELNNIEANSMSQSLGPAYCSTSYIDSHCCTFDGFSNGRCQHNCAAIVGK